MFSVLEVVPLTLLTLDAWHFVRTTRGRCDVCGKAIAIPEVREKLVAQGFTVVGSSPEELGVATREQLARYATLMKQAGIKAQ